MGQYAQRVEFFLIEEIIELTHVRSLQCEAEVRSSSVGVVYVVCLRIVFSKATLQKRGSMEPNEPPLDPPLGNCGACSKPTEFHQQCFLMPNSTLVKIAPPSE